VDPPFCIRFVIALIVLTFSNNSTFCFYSGFIKSTLVLAGICKLFVGFYTSTTSILNYNLFLFSRLIDTIMHIDIVYISKYTQHHI
jgi:hypothetical protein